MNSQVALDEYAQALRLGQKEYRELMMAGKDPHPAVLDEILPELSTETVLSIGLVDIPAESKWDFSTFRMNNTLFSTNGIPGRSDFVVGLKLTFCIGFYSQKCPPCKADEIR